MNYYRIPEILVGFWNFRNRWGSVTYSDAASWKEEFLARKIDEAEKNDTDLKLGTFKEVKETIRKSFEPFDGPGDALKEMKRL